MLIALIKWDRIYIYIFCSIFLSNYGRVKSKRGAFMKFQWSLLFGLLFAIIIALFAVYNVDVVPVNYVFGTAQWPLILVILGSALLGALLSGTVAIYRSFVLARKVKHLEKELELKDASIGSLQNELVAQNDSKQSSFSETVIVKDENTTI